MLTSCVVLLVTLRWLGAAGRVLCQTTHMTRYQESAHERHGACSRPCMAGIRARNGRTTVRPLQIRRDREYPRRRMLAADDVDGAGEVVKDQRIADPRGGNGVARCGAVARSAPRAAKSQPTRTRRSRARRAVPRIGHTIGHPQTPSFRVARPAVRCAPTRPRGRPRIALSIHARVAPQPAPSISAALPVGGGRAKMRQGNTHMICSGKRGD